MSLFTFTSTRQHLLVFLLLLNNVSAEVPTDEQLINLEKQIEQQEATEKKRQAEAEKLRQEQNRLAEERQKLEQQRLELESIRAAEREKQIQEKAARNSKIELHINRAEEAKQQKDFKNAESEYNKILEIDPGNTIAQKGIAHIRELENRCKSIIGDWGWDGTSQTMTFEADGTVVHRAAFNTVVKNDWECADPENYRFIMLYGGKQSDYFLSKDGEKLNGGDPWGNISDAIRVEPR